MVNIEKTLYRIHRYGIFFRPYFNYLIETAVDEDIKIFLEISLLKEKKEYEDIIKVINKKISSVKNCNIYYLLLAMKMSAQCVLKMEDYKISYKILKKNLKKIPPFAREILKPIFLSVEGNKNIFQKSRFWGKSTFEDNYFKAYYLIGLARREKDLSKKRLLLSNSIIISREIPNPSLIKAALGELEMTFKENNWKNKYLSKLNVYYTSYYFLDISQSIFSLKKYIKSLKREKNILYFIELEMLRRIIIKMNMSKEMFDKSDSEYEIIDQAINLEFDKNSYDITEEIYNSIKIMSEKQNINKYSKKHGISRTTIYSILNKENTKLNSKTIRKVIANIGTFNERLPYIFHLERFKYYIDKEIENLYYYLKTLNEEKYILNAFSTYMAYIKFHKTKNKKLKLLMKLKKMSLNKLLSLEYNYKYFLIQLLPKNTSIFLKARIDLIKSNLKNLDYNYQKELFFNYISKNNEDREIIDQLMMNFKRFENIDIIEDIDYNLKYPNPVSKQNLINSLYSIEKEKRDRAYELIIESLKLKTKSY